MKQLSGLSARCVGVLLLALTVSGNAAAQDERFDGTTIRVATWGGSWRDRIQELIGQEFEKRGGHIEYVIGNPLDNFNKLIASRGQRPPFDVIEFQADTWRPLVETGMLEQLPRTKIPNASKAVPGQDDGATIATWILEEGIAYNPEKFQQLGIPKPTKYSDLFNEKLKGRIAWPDIGYGPYALIGLSTEFGGDEQNVSSGLRRLQQASIDYFYRSSVELATKFASGDVWAAPWHAGWAVRLKRSGVPIAMSFPTVKDRKGILVNGMIGIVKGTEVQRAAEFWVNCYLSPDVQEKLGRANGIAPISEAALRNMSSDQGLSELMLLSRDDLSKAYTIDWAKTDMSDIVSKWNRTTKR